MLEYIICTRPPDEIIVLIAQFDGPEPEKYRVTDFVIEELRQVTDKYDDIKISPLNETVKVEEGSDVARNLARQAKARMIIWGWYSVTGEAIHTRTYVEMLDMPAEWGFFSDPNAIIDTTNTSETTKPSLDAETFQFQTSLSESVSASSIFSIGLLLYRKSRYEDALELFTKALETLSEDDYLVNSSQILSERALAHLRLGMFDEALEDAEKAVEAISNTPENSGNAYHNRGLVHFYRKNLQLALMDFQRSEDNTSLYMQGVVYHMLDEDEKAIGIFTQVIEAEPDFGMAYFQRAVVYQELGMKSEAKTDLRMAIQLVSDPETKQWFENLIVKIDEP